MANTIKCKRHPDYTVEKPPETGNGCWFCWRAWNFKVGRGGAFPATPPKQVKERPPRPRIGKPLWSWSSNKSARKVNITAKKFIG